MKANEWEYVGEGGKHALFAYCLREGLASEDDRWRGMLLRLQKDYLAQASHVVKKAVDNQSTSLRAADLLRNSSDIDKNNVSTRYIREIIAPHLLYYVDVPVPLLLDWRFVDELCKQTLAKTSGTIIPPSRRHQWISDGNRDYNTKQDDDSNDFEPQQAPAATGLLLRNFRGTATKATQPIPSSDIGSIDRSISVEIKPKAGYVAFSPLVNPSCRIKYQHSRFVLLQKLHQLGVVNKSWASDDHQKLINISSYDPLDLYSNDPRRVSKAIDALFDCPQNNLKIWSADKLLLGYSNTYVSEDWKAISHNLMFDDAIENSGNESSSSALKKILTEILCKEQVLQKLLQMQMLDILDADGAILLYERLVELCENSKEKAEELLDDIFCQKNPTSLTKPGPSLHKLLENSPFFTPVRDVSKLQKFCDQVESCQRSLAKSSPALPEDNFLNTTREDALRIIQTFDIEDCVYLLKNWMLSLAMNDVSFFIILKSESLPSTPVSIVDNRQTGQVLTMQSQDKPGVYALLPQTPQKMSAHVVLNYELKIIDCDQKPAKKIRTRAAKEEEFKQLPL